MESGKDFRGEGCVSNGSVPCFSHSLQLLLSIAICNRSSDEIVRPRVPLEACLANFSAPEEIQDFYSSALKAKTTALKYALRFLSGF